MRTITLMKEARFGKQGDNLVSVALPHTWNNLDGTVMEENSEHTKVDSLHSVMI